jgi:hypothetical protein
MFGLRSPARSVLAVGAIGAVATLLSAGVASADISIDKTFTWNTTYPGLGAVSGISTEVVATMTSPVPVGTPESTNVTINLDLPATVTNYLIGQGVVSVTSGGDVWITVTDPNGTRANVDASVQGPAVAVAGSGKDTRATVTGTVGFPGTENTGTASAAIYPQHVVVTLTATTASGATVGPTSVNLALSPSTQDPTLGSIQVTSGS